MAPRSLHRNRPKRVKHNATTIETPKGPSNYFPFLKLPAEVRNMVYDYALDWNDINARLETLQEELRRDPRSQAVKERRLNTPTVLLINHQITAEALHILEKKPLVFKTNPPYHYLLHQPYDNTFGKFIGELTLRRVPEIVFDVTYRTPPHILDSFWYEVIKVCCTVRGHNQPKNMHINLETGYGENGTVQRQDLDLLFENYKTLKEDPTVTVDQNFTDAYARHLAELAERSDSE